MVHRCVFRSLLVAVDLTPVSDRVVGRAALLPLAADARLTLLHVVSISLPASARKAAERDARKALRDEEIALKDVLPETIEIETVVRVGTPAAEIIECATLAHAELIVMGRGSGRMVRDSLLGSTAERVLRQVTRPVLVVRLRPRKPYRRPGLALELDAAARQVIAFLPRVIAAPRPRVAIIHVCDPPYRGMMYPSLPGHDMLDALDEQRDVVVRELSKLISSAFAEAKITPKGRPALAMHVQHGSARAIIEKTTEKAELDLLMLGTHGHTGIARAFLGTVAGDVLRNVGCDVLVVPPRAPK
jgi:nucleotide-binding universal stress UspA family protein